MSEEVKAMRVIIPLNVRKRNGRPKILPPADSPANDDPGPDPHIMKAIAQAWSWRRRLECGACSTNRDLAAADRISNQFISRHIRLAYLAPAVLERLLIRREPPAISIRELTFAADLPWEEQEQVVFGS